MSTTTTTGGNASKKRKQTVNPPTSSTNPLKKARGGAAQQALIGPHEAIIAQLSSRWTVLAASVISSTQIRKRFESATTHLLNGPATSATGAEEAKPRLVMLHARPAEVCKMITIAEQCKRLLVDQKKSWYQYNQLFDLPAGARKRKDVVEETILEQEPQDESDSESDAFETMENRFENAVLPPPKARTYKSLRIFVSLEAVPELKSLPDVTVQSSEELE